MYRFHASIHARPDDCQKGEAVELGELRLATCAIPQERLGASSFSRSFEEVSARLAQLPRMYIEPDGSFVWTSGHGEAVWQVDGNLYDHQDRVCLVDAKGSCPPERFDELLATLGWPATPLVFQLVRAAVCLDETEFRRFASQARADAGSPYTA